MGVCISLIDCRNKSLAQEAKNEGMPSLLDSHGCEELPMLELLYLAEGAANVIYRLKLGPDENSSHTRFTPYLLRLRKTLYSSAPNLAAYQSLQKRFFPLLPEDGVISTILVRLPPGLTTRENAKLLELERSGNRPVKRHGLYLAEDEQYGFLLEDMSPFSPSIVLVEFKPKWLLQSGSAPKSAKRCRTCALRLYKANRSAAKGKQVFLSEDAWFCPLDLASGREDRVLRAVQGILVTKGAVRTMKGVPIPDGKAMERLRDRLAAALTGNAIIRRVRELQDRFDKDGVIDILANYKDGENQETNPRVWNLTTCMTLRDLTLFCKVRPSSLIGNN